MRNDLQAAVAHLEAMAQNAIGAAADADMPEQQKTALWAEYKALDTALTAIRDMMRRRAGCEYCAVNDWERTPLATFYTYFNNYSAEQHEIGIDDYEGGYRIASTMNSNGLSIDIQFCPMCGRKLEVEG